jgi:hypothetical protein
MKLLDKWIEQFKACPNAVAQHERDPGACADTDPDLLTENLYYVSPLIVADGAL